MKEKLSWNKGGIIVQRDKKNPRGKTCLDSTFYLDDGRSIL
jgi:hypothetical protein